MCIGLYMWKSGVLREFGNFQSNTLYISEMSLSITFPHSTYLDFRTVPVYLIHLMLPENRLTKIGWIGWRLEIDWAWFPMWPADSRVWTDTCLASAVQAGGVGCYGVRNVCLAHIGPLSIPIKRHLNATAYLSIVPDHVKLFISAVYPYNALSTSCMIAHHDTKHNLS